MTWFIFVGDMLVMAFMIVVVVWVSLRSKPVPARRGLADSTRG